MTSPSAHVRFAGLGVLTALIASSGLAYLWPSVCQWASVSETLDPFQLPSTALLSLVALTMFCLGLAVQPIELEELRRRPSMVLFGVLVQCTVMPALAWMIVHLIGLEGPLAYGVMLCGCVPGAMASNVLTMTAGGNVSYSVSLTSIATLLSPITVPTALTIIAGLETGNEVFKPGKMAVTLVLTVVLPVVIGYLTKQQIPKIRHVAARFAPPLATLALLWIIASVVAANRDRLGQISGTLLAGLLTMNLVGYVAGFYFGKIAKMPGSMQRALTLEVGMQNAGLGTALAASLLDDSALAQVPTAAYTFGCMLTGTILASIWANRPASTSVETDPSVPSA